MVIVVIDVVVVIVSRPGERWAPDFIIMPPKRMDPREINLIATFVLSCLLGEVRISLKLTDEMAKVEQNVVIIILSVVVFCTKHRKLIAKNYYSNNKQILHMQNSNFTCCVVFCLVAKRNQLTS